ncbi:nucleoside diphosphate phosphatase ENTPD5 [Spea bombifrons]|uniref:nucleoside diphosphate phosphatase ENTPD5 n=1 Tax=Spea bombifrons TaxID=233779 RepID=UPI00234A0FCC|nr:nucleoside diphosphate phosphatase ENTPD5 [Spea bombifrons]XP_053330817.1 nucleoside diphosphate phosphatase ENTPD5 [Spea bombifrons]XP_053330818.1 nucleoside diphosphate phosphatase ENTPD5 [Spea bombifrons]
MQRVAPQIPVLFLACVALFTACVARAERGSSPLPPAPGGQEAAEALYGIVFDAGSTGTRIHVYTFRRRAGGIMDAHTGSRLQLEGEVFESVKPGLSAFADHPEKGADTVRALLDLAQNVVPDTHWRRTPLILKATAGLRLLSHHQAEALLTQVRLVFRVSPFLVLDNSVSIMDGSDEGTLAWVSVNYLTGRLHGRHSVGILDLGGGSTQITFLPLDKATLDDTPREFLAVVELFNSTYRLYTRSYLGLGLMAARLAVLGASGSGVPQGHVFRSHCLPQNMDSEWSFAGVSYRYGGKSDGVGGFNACYSEVLPIVRGKIHQVAEVRDRHFYAFSYFYDCAAESAMIDYKHGGVLELRDFSRKAREVCENMSAFSPLTPFLCMDLTYITALLRDGFGFEDGTRLQLTKKVKDVEMSWTLGAAFQLLQTLAQ